MGTRRVPWSKDVVTSPAARRALPTKAAVALAGAGMAVALAAAPVLAAPAVPTPAAAVALPAPDGTSSVRTIRPPSDFRAELVRMKRHTKVPILLPATMRIEEPKGHGVEVKWHADRRRWNLMLGIGPRCGGANACFVGYLAGQRGGKPPAFRRKVVLRDHTRGWFKPSSCGASCAPPQLEWQTGGVLYTIQLFEPGRGSDLHKLATLANSAIAGGPR